MECLTLPDHGHEAQHSGVAVIFGSRPCRLLEERVVLAPFLATSPLIADLHGGGDADQRKPGVRQLACPQIRTGPSRPPAPITTVSQLTDASSFGGDMVRIEAGPGGDFGKGVYAISQAAGANADASFRSSNLPVPINRPGVIYRVDPATGKASVFFDINTVLCPDPSAVSAVYMCCLFPQHRTRELVRHRLRSRRRFFDGRPSMFVTSPQRH